MPETVSLVPQRLSKNLQLIGHHIFDNIVELETIYVEIVEKKTNVDVLFLMDSTFFSGVNLLRNYGTLAKGGISLFIRAIPNVSIIHWSCFIFQGIFDSGFAEPPEPQSTGITLAAGFFGIGIATPS